jgi:hypothetical protein
MRTKLGSWVRKEGTKIVDLVVLAFMIVAPLWISACDPPDTHPQDTMYGVELEYRKQGNSTVTYNCFPYGVNLLATQLEAEGISLSLPGSAIPLTIELLDEFNLRWKEWVESVAEKKPGSGIALRKRFLFAIRGFKDPDFPTQSNCEVGGLTKWENYNDPNSIWAAFVCCGQQQDCSPSNPPNLDSISIQLSTHHELGHMASPYIPHCDANPAWHTGGPSSACVMFYMVRFYVFGPEIRLSCGRPGDGYLENTYDFCSACRTEIRSKAENWPK